MSFTLEVLCDGFYYSLIDEKVLESFHNCTELLTLPLSSRAEPDITTSGLLHITITLQGRKGTPQLSSEAGEKKTKPLDN